LLWIRDDFLAKHTPGDSVPVQMQLLKGCMRESEVDRVWVSYSITRTRTASTNTNAASYIGSFSHAHVENSSYAQQVKICDIC